jgi:hypothetical protein
MIELTSVVTSERFRCHILWIWRNLTVLWIQGRWPLAEALSNQPISDSVTFKAGIAQYRLGKVVSAWRMKRHMNTSQRRMYRLRVSRKSKVGTPGWRARIKGDSRGCLELAVSVRWVWWWTVLFKSYLRLRACHTLKVWSDWPPCFTVVSEGKYHNGFLQGQ